MMSIVYALSLKTFRNLDFKGFLLLIFLINNTQVLLRIVLSQLGIEETTYH